MLNSLDTVLSTRDIKKYWTWENINSVYVQKMNVENAHFKFFIFKIMTYFLNAGVILLPHLANYYFERTGLQYTKMK